MMIEVDDDVSDKILVAGLVEQYNSMVDRLNLGLYIHPEDKDYWINNLLPAIRVVGDYFDPEFKGKIEDVRPL